MTIREKKIHSGKLFEASFFPVQSDGRKAPARAPKTKPTSNEQKLLNAKNARKKLKQLIETNFSENDTVFHGTFRDSEMPDNYDDCLRVVQNYIKRVKRYRAKNGLCEMKYIFVIEAKVSKRTGVLRWHTHMIMSGMDRNDTEKLWGHGDYVNADRLQAGEHGFAAIAVYLAKKPEGAKRWCESRNLHKPNISPPRDGKISKKYLAKLATERADDSAYWESRYKGYRFLESEIRYNDYNGYWYVDIVMYKRS